MAPQSSLIPSPECAETGITGISSPKPKVLRTSLRRRGPLAARDLVDLGGGHDQRRPQARQVLVRLDVQRGCPHLAVHQQHDRVRRLLPEVPLHPRRPLPPLVLPGLGVAVAGQVDEVEAPVHQEVVDRLRPPRSRARAGEALASQEPVQQARLADVRASDESDLGTPVPQVIPAPMSRPDELRAFDLQLDFSTETRAFRPGRIRYRFSGPGNPSPQALRRESP